MSVEELQMLSKKLELNTDNICNQILSTHKIMFSNGLFFEYGDGVYSQLSAEKLAVYIYDMVRDRFTTRLRNEVVSCLQAKTHVPGDMMNSDDVLNLKNGILHVHSETMAQHNPLIYSTIQLPVKYDIKATCPTWIRTIAEIFEGNGSKMNVLQEFFGLCLTRDMRHCKALYMLGEGRNGKSTVLSILETIVGDKNRTAIPIEMLSNKHYVANLYGKLVNISVETNTNTEVHDATFKQITSGDSIDADRKYGHPFTFRPFCKLIYALNNMPRVSDKTDSYFERLIILKFNRQFKDGSENKNLKNELLQEIDGIFMWCLEGYYRLMANGKFSTCEEIQKEVFVHRMENNNVMLFMEDECEMDPKGWVSKKELYEVYAKWCKDSGHHALSKIKFSKEITRRYDLKEDTTGHNNARVWVGINLKNGGAN
jgi:putative DNA primase/helicase